MVIDNATALLVGTTFGFILSLMNLPTPAPTALAGVTAVLGAFIGGEVYKIVMPMMGF